MHFNIIKFNVCYVLNLENKSENFLCDFDLAHSRIAETHRLFVFQRTLFFSDFIRDKCQVRCLKKTLSLKTSSFHHRWQRNQNIHCPRRDLTKDSIPKARCFNRRLPHLLGHSLIFGLQAPQSKWPFPHWYISVGGSIGSKHTGHSGSFGEEGAAGRPTLKSATLSPLGFRGQVPSSFLLSMMINESVNNPASCTVLSSLVNCS